MIAADEKTMLMQQHHFHQLQLQQFHLHAQHVESTNRRDDLCVCFINSLISCLKGRSVLPASLLAMWEMRSGVAACDALRSLGYHSFKDFLTFEPHAQKSFELSPDGYVFRRLVAVGNDEPNRCRLTPNPNAPRRDLALATYVDFIPNAEMMFTDHPTPHFPMQKLVVVPNAFQPPYPQPRPMLIPTPTINERVMFPVVTPPPTPKVQQSTRARSPTIKTHTTIRNHTTTVRSRPLVSTERIDLDSSPVGEKPVRPDPSKQHTARSRSPRRKEKRDCTPPVPVKAKPPVIRLPPKRMMTTTGKPKLAPGDRVYMRTRNLSCERVVEKRAIRKKPRNVPAVASSKASNKFDPRRRAPPPPVLGPALYLGTDMSIVEMSIVELLAIKNPLSLLLFRTLWENVHAGASLHPQKFGHSDLQSFVSDVPTVNIEESEEGVCAVLAKESVGSKHTRRQFEDFRSRFAVPPDDDGFFASGSLLRRLHEELRLRRKKREGQQFDITLPTCAWSFEYTNGRKMCRARLWAPTGHFEAIVGKFCQARQLFPVEVTAQISCALEATQVLQLPIAFSEKQLELVAKYEQDAELVWSEDNEGIPRLPHVDIDDRSFASFLRALHSEDVAVGVATDGESVGIALSTTIFQCRFTGFTQLNSGLRCVLVRSLMNIAAKAHSNKKQVAIGGAWKKEIRPILSRKTCDSPVQRGGRVAEAFHDIMAHHTASLRSLEWIDINQASAPLNVKAQQARRNVLAELERRRWEDELREECRVLSVGRKAQNKE